jgi:hypothetical protein
MLEDQRHGCVLGGVEVKEGGERVVEGRIVAKHSLTDKMS